MAPREVVQEVPESTRDQVLRGPRGRRRRRAGGRTEAVVRSLRAIPPVEYRNRAEVMRSVPVDPGAGRAAEQARTRSPSGVAEHMREPR